jgi:hypothetical protein
MVRNVGWDLAVGLEEPVSKGLIGVVISGIN